MKSWSKDASAVLDRTRIMTTFDWNTRSYMKIWDFIKTNIYMAVSQATEQVDNSLLLWNWKGKKKKNQSSNLSFLDVRFSFLESLELYF